MPPPGQVDIGIAESPAQPSVVTITAEPGADALRVGRLVAQQGGLRFVGAEAAAMVVRRTGLPLDVVAELLTRVAPPDEVPILGGPATHTKNYVVSELRRAISSVAAGRPAVVVCVGAADVLAGDPRVLHVLLVGRRDRHREEVEPGRFDLAIAMDHDGVDAAAAQIGAFLRQAPRR